MNDAEIRNCPACASRERRIIGTKNAFDICGCRKCGSLYTGRVPVKEESQDYDGYYTESNLSVPDFVRRRVGEIVAEFSGYRKLNRLLDIGFGAGTLLETASEQNWQPFGLEVSKPAVEQARARGFEVFHGGLTAAQYPDGHFDVVTASEILEHLPDPVGDLREIARILRPGGLFWATTPSARSLSFRLMKEGWSVLSPPEHIQLYSRGGAWIMLKEAGFSTVAFKTYGLNPAEIASRFRRSSSIETGFERVSTAYELNEKLTRNKGRRAIKRGLNETLNLLGIGDSLKIYATK